jgi:antitoxin component YwqK of YwqJK toxin-antitoxin module
MLYLILAFSPLLLYTQVLTSDLSDGLNSSGVLIKYLKVESVPFNGNVFNYYPNGKKELKGIYYKGLKDARWVYGSGGSQTVN